MQNLPAKHLWDSLTPEFLDFRLLATILVVKYRSLDVFGQSFQEVSSGVLLDLDGDERQRESKQKQGVGCHIPWAVRVSIFGGSCKFYWDVEGNTVVFLVGWALACRRAGLGGTSAK